MSGASEDKQDFQDGRVTGRVVAQPPADLLTDGGYGPNRRLRVDVGETGFFAGREFRTFKEYTVAANATVWIKIVTPINAILQGLGIQLDEGFVKLKAYVNATETAAFNNALPIRPANSMTERPFPYYVPQVTVSDGGTATTGSATLIDILSMKTANNSNQASTNDAAVPGVRGVAAGTYYLELVNQLNSQALLTFRARWEERP